MLNEQVAAFVIVVCCLFGQEAHSIQYEDAPVDRNEFGMGKTHEDDFKGGEPVHNEDGARMNA